MSDATLVQKYLHSCEKPSKQSLFIDPGPKVNNQSNEHHMPSNMRVTVKDCLVVDTLSSILTHLTSKSSNGKTRKTRLTS